MSKYKEDIIKLRKEEKSYKQIEEILGCSRGTISYHCQKEGLTDIGLSKSNKISDDKKEKIKKYYKNNTKRETSKKFNVSGRTVLKYGDNKRKSKLTEKEKRNKDKLRHRRLRRRKKKKAIKYLGGKCEKCGYETDCLNVFDFHHKNSDDKESRISALISRCRKWKVIKKELEKCELLCANCHREVHYTHHEVLDKED